MHTDTAFQILRKHPRQLVEIIDAELRNANFDNAMTLAATFDIDLDQPNFRKTVLSACSTAAALEFDTLLTNGFAVFDLQQAVSVILEALQDSAENFDKQTVERALHNFNVVCSIMQSGKNQKQFENDGRLVARMLRCFCRTAASHETSAVLLLCLRKLQDHRVFTEFLNQIFSGVHHFAASCDPESIATEEKQTLLEDFIREHAEEFLGSFAAATNASAAVRDACPRDDSQTLLQRFHVLFFELFSLKYFANPAAFAVAEFLQQSNCPKPQSPRIPCILRDQFSVTELLRQTSRHPEAQSAVLHTLQLYPELANAVYSRGSGKVVLLQYENFFSTEAVPKSEMRRYQVAANLTKADFHDDTQSRFFDAYVATLPHGIFHTDAAFQRCLRQVCVDALLQLDFRAARYLLEVSPVAKHLELTPEDLTQLYSSGKKSIREYLRAAILLEPPETEIRPRFLKSWTGPRAYDAGAFLRPALNATQIPIESWHLFREAEVARKSLQAGFELTRANLEQDALRAQHTQPRVRRL